MSLELAVLVGAILCAIIGLKWVFFNNKQVYAPGVPIYGGADDASLKKNRVRFVHDSKTMLLEGYQQNDRGPFYVPSKLGERLMLPSKYLEDLKSAPVHEVDFVATFIEMFEGKYTTMGSRSTLHPRVVRGQLNRNLWTVMSEVEEEISDAFHDSWPACDDWTEVDVMDRIVQVVARVSSRMFGGTTLSRNNEWVQASINFATDGFIGAQALKAYPEMLKPIVAKFTPAIQQIKKHYEAAEKAAIPLLNQREKTGEAAPDLLYWMAQDAKDDERDKKFLAGILLKVSFAAIHTSAAAPTQLLYDLCAMPEYVEPLREEIRRNTAEGSLMTRKNYEGLTKLDSIMKESQRHNPLLLITFERVVTKNYTLSDGFVIPAHTTIGIPTHAISMDPEIVADPESFDGFRFDQSSSSSSSAAKDTSSSNAPDDKTPSNLYAAARPTSMAFGYGRHACPGRFFASAEIKAIMVHLLRNYDFKFVPGKEVRPPSLIFETQNLPNPEGRLLFKKRKVAA